MTTTTDAEAELELAEAEAKASPPAAPPSKPSTGGSAPMAALRGYGQGASLGFSDELGGVVRGGGAALNRGATDLAQTEVGRWLLRKAFPGLEKLPDDVMNSAMEQAGQDANQLVTGMPSLPQGYGDALVGGYRSGRDEMRVDNKAAQEANPASYRAGSLAGMLSTPMGRTKPGLNMATARTGAMLGAASGLGASDSDSVLGDVASTLAGGAIGGVAAPLVSGLANRGAGLLGKWAQEAAARAGGFRSGLSNADAVRAYGQQLLDEGVIGLGSKPEEVLARAQRDLPTQYGALYDDAFAAAKAAGVALPTFPTLRALGAAAGGNGTATDLAAAGPAMNLASLLGKQAQIEAARVGAPWKTALEVPLDVANQLKSGMYKFLPSGAFTSTTERAGVGQQTAVIGALKDAIEQQMGKVPDDGVSLGALQAANSKFGFLKTMEELAGDASTRELGKDAVANALKFGLAGGGLSGAGSVLLGLHGGRNPGGRDASGSALGGTIGALGGALLAPRVSSTAALANQLASRLAGAAGPVVSRLATQAAASDAGRAAGDAWDELKRALSPQESAAHFTSGQMGGAGGSQK